MRDIANTNEFSASTVQTKNKVTRMNSNSGTLTRGDYRSYRDFLESYGDNKNPKDDQESVSSTDSGISSSYKLSESKSNNTSTSSLNSEINGTNSKVLSKNEQSTGLTNRTGSFRNYMESYNNKKFTSVKPKIAPAKQNLIKSEIVIQVKDPLEKEKLEPQAIFVTTINGDEGEVFVDTLPPPPNFMLPPTAPSPPNSLPPPPPLPKSMPPAPPLPNSMPPPHDDAVITFIPPPPKLPPPAPKLPPPVNTAGKKWGIVKTEDQRPNSNPGQPEKLPANHAAAASLAKILTQHLLPKRKELEAQQNLNEDVTDNRQKVMAVIPPAPKLPENTQNGNAAPCQKAAYVSVMPKLPQYPSQPQKITVELNAPKLPPTPPPVMPQKMTTRTSVFPTKVESFTLPRQSKKVIEFPAPKLPQTSPPQVPKFHAKMATGPKLPPTSPPRTPSGRNSPNGSVEFKTTTVVPVTNGTTQVSKNDPNVKKLVYNTYRGLLGAYNNKANDMIATLPRNMVREDQGVSKQLESMALQGGLDKLNGRTNPNVEQE